MKQFKIGYPPIEPIRTFKEERLYVNQKNKSISNLQEIINWAGRLGAKSGEFVNLCFDYDNNKFYFSLQLAEPEETFAKKFHKWEKEYRQYEVYRANSRKK